MAKFELRFVEKEPQEKSIEQQKRLLDQAFYAISTVACNAINQSRKENGAPSVTEETARDIVLCWVNK